MSGRRFWRHAQWVAEHGREVDTHSGDAAPSRAPGQGQIPKEMEYLVEHPPGTVMVAERWWPPRPLESTIVALLELNRIHLIDGVSSDNGIQGLYAWPDDAAKAKKLLANDAILRDLESTYTNDLTANPAFTGSFAVVRRLAEKRAPTDVKLTLFDSVFDRYRASDWKWELAYKSVLYRPTPHTTALAIVVQVTVSKGTLRQRIKMVAGADHAVFWISESPLKN